MKVGFKGVTELAQQQERESSEPRLALGGKRGVMTDLGI